MVWEQSEEQGERNTLLGVWPVVDRRKMSFASKFLDVNKHCSTSECTMISDFKCWGSFYWAVGDVPIGGKISALQIKFLWNVVLKKKHN